MKFPAAFLIAISGVGLLVPARATNFNITGTTTAGQSLSANQSGTVTSTGLLQVGSSTNAVAITGNAILINSGTITQTGTGRGIRDNAGSLTLTVTNNAGALIQTADADVIQMNVAGSNVTFNNSGTLNSKNASAGGNQAIDFNALTTGSNTLNNFSTGTITASEADAVRPGANGVINNSGTIKSTTTTGSSSDGIDLQTNISGVTITNAASVTNGAGATNLIEGARHAITGGQDIDTKNTSTYNLPYTLTITNNAGGTIQGDNGSGVNIDGVGSKEVVTITNAGMISGNGHNIGDGKSHDGDGVDVDGLVNLINTGTIVSKDAYEDTSEGVTVGGGTITNSGLIEGSVTAAGAASGSVGRGITLSGVDKTVFSGTTTTIPAQPIYADTTVTNMTGGVIRGDTDSAIAFAGTGTQTLFTGTITNQSGALIEGGGATAAAISATAVANAITINNAGTIKADTSGSAIALGSGNDKVNITGGAASVQGNMDGGTGTNALVIDPGAGNSFSYSNAISNFNSVEVKSGTVTLAGTSNYTGSTTLSGGTTYANNSNGSATGLGSTLVSTNATIAGTGTIKPSGANGLKVTAGGTLAPGGVQPLAVNDGSANPANGSLTLDTTSLTPGATIAGITDAKLTFALGSGDANSGSQLKIIGGVANTIAFGGTSTITINDLVDTHLTLNQEYVLIDGNNTTYTGLQYGATTALGTEITGGLQLLAANTPGNFFSEWYTSSKLYLVGDNIEVNVVPEPSTWAMMLGGLGVMVFAIRRKRRA